MDKKSISFVIPAYNEEELIGSSIEKVYHALETTGRNFELIIADDGSKDSTYEKISEKIKSHPKIRVVRNSSNKGRGSALRKAFKAAKGDYQVYADADLSIDLSLLMRLIDEIENGADIAIGSKHLPQSCIEYSYLRSLLSNSYSFLVRALFRTDIRDFQCGFKCFKRTAFTPVLEMTKSDGWFWDTEILLRSHFLGLRIAEIPAAVIIPSRKSKVSLFRDAYRMGADLLRFWLHTKVL